jgi:transposase InsO family protein
MCLECAQKKSRPRSGIVVKPIITEKYGQRTQVDLVDMQSSPDGNYKYILNVQDHCSKFCILRPLMNKTAVAVATELLDIFCLMGAPKILHSDNGREFTAKVIDELRLLWPEMVLVNGKPRHPQSQGSVERANGDFMNMLGAWMRQNSSTK